MIEKNTEQMQPTGMEPNPDSAAAELVEGLENALSEPSSEEAVPAPEVDVNALLETVARLEAELAEARQQCADITEKSQRLAAEFQNSRRRQERQLAEEMERTSAYIIRRLLPVLDDFDLALAHAPEGDDAWNAWVDGVRQIRRKLYAVLEEEGLAPIPTDGAFDPTLHEAISSAPSETVESGHILETLRAGYTLKGRVLRPALVRVAM
ncbi:MAG: nucleotide exchange factor GrpE [Caldilinea sp.]|nr:nucleotide exchange factor GrpE [Caldilinea sp.]MDW8440303.1 nucleotide exchange factor GrpE [Caldilineaceae bacterium]